MWCPARLRMHPAADLLATSREGVAAVAGRVGYGPEGAFHRAFERLVGSPPAAWRRWGAGARRGDVG